MLIGLGDLGNHILNFLARTPFLPEITVADVNADSSLLKIAQARYGAWFQGFHPEIRYVKLDLSNVEYLSRVLQETKPKVICTSAVLYADYLRPPLTAEVIDKIHTKYDGDACFNSLHIYCALKVMQAVKKSGIETKVINTSFPDVTHPVLKGMGLSPTCGGGNIALATGFMQEVVSEELHVPFTEIQIFLVCHHSWARRAENGIPYFVKILSGANDVTEKFPPVKLCREMRRIRDRYQMDRSGPLGEGARYHQQWIASAFVRSILAICFNTHQLCHAPGPNGLPGGYPCRLSEAGCEVYLPREITLEKAVEINVQGGRFDGIETIVSDGTLIRTDGSSLKPGDIEQVALDLLSIIKRGR